MSQEMICATARTLARAAGSFGRNGGDGWVSSRYSMMASDCNRMSPLSSLSAGPEGLSSRAGIRQCAGLTRASIKCVFSSRWMPRSRRCAAARQRQLAAALDRDERVAIVRLALVRVARDGAGNVVALDLAEG